MTSCLTEAASESCNSSINTEFGPLTELSLEQIACHACKHFPYTSSRRRPMLMALSLTASHLHTLSLNAHISIKTVVVKGSIESTCLGRALFCMDSMVSAVCIHISAAPDGMTKCPVVSAACCLLGGPPASLKVKEPNGFHLRATCVTAFNSTYTSLPKQFGLATEVLT